MPADEAAPLYDVVVVVHVVGAIVGFGALVTAGIFAGRARRCSRSNVEALRRYFSGETNWVARSIYTVPVLGVVLLAMSDGEYRFDELWLLSSVVMWVLALALAELVIFPGERSIGEALAGAAPATAPTDAAISLRPEVEVTCARVMVAAAGEAALFVLSLVVMLAKPA